VLGLHLHVHVLDKHANHTCQFLKVSVLLFQALFIVCYLILQLLETDVGIRLLP
jgi:hypothetical protein